MTDVAALPALASTLPAAGTPVGSAAGFRATVALQTLGSPDAASCVGDFCAIPEHHEQSVVNRRIDEDLV